MARTARALRSLFEQLFLRRELRFWTVATTRAETIDIPGLRGLRTRARALRGRLDDVIRVADARLALPALGSNLFPVPQCTDWSWRPEMWRGPIRNAGVASVPSGTQLGDEVTLHHDCLRSELSLRQIRNNRESDLAPFGMTMEVYAFDGTFLSLVLELPKGAIEGLRQNHLIRLTMLVELEKPLEIFARLNIAHGPNTEQVTRELPRPGPETMVEFDLAYTNLNEKRIEKAWVDLIFEDPQMNQIVLRDVTFARCPRAEF